MGRKTDGDDVLFGGYVPPIKKAVALATIAAMKARGVEMTQMGLILHGVAYFAKRFGVLDTNGEVAEGWKDEVAAIEVVIREKRDEERKRNAAKRKMKGPAK